jgi:hypothetical protein
MKASEAVLLGALVTPDPQPWNIKYCALGMMANAMNMPSGEGRRVALGKMWPWLTEADNPWFRQHNRELVDMLKHLPPAVAMGERIVAAACPWSWIATVFNREVFPGHMTLEELAEYIRKMEPECGECNSFDCHCPDLFSALRAPDPLCRAVPVARNDTSQLTLTGNRNGPT